MLMRKVLVAALLVVAAGGTPQLASAQLAGPAAPTAFTGNNGKIVFSAFPASGANFEEIYTINPDGTGLDRLTTNNANGIGDVWPDFSPDGRFIVLERASSTATKLVIINRSGTTVDAVRDGGCAAPAWPSWSPDMSAIVFSCMDSAVTHIWVTQTTGGSAWSPGASWQAPVQFTNDAEGSDQTPEWSPDGSKIVFARNYESSTGAYSDIVFVRVAGAAGSLAPGTEQLVTDHPVPASGHNGIEDSYPDWHPDGHKVVYSRWSDALGRGEIFTTTLAGVTTRLTTTSRFYETMPAYAPNGKRIVWARSDPFAQTADDLVMYNVATDTRTPLTSGDRRDQEPDWGVAP
jgi:Tol biopolymer transport system component